MKRAGTALLAASALAAASCGESEEDKYVEGFEPLNRDIRQLGRQVGESLQEARGKSDQQIEDEFGNHAQDLGRLQQRVDDLEPPEGLKAAQENLVEAMGETQGDLEDISEAAEQGDANAARNATVELVQGSQELRDARRRLAREVRGLEEG